MIKFSVESCNLKTKKKNLEHFLNENYLRFYKKERFRHMAKQDRRLPNLKITDDIFSVQIWFKDKQKVEHRIFVDGSILLDTVKIHTITIQKQSFKEFEYQIYLDIIKQLSKLADGHIFMSTNSLPQRMIDGKIEDYDVFSEGFEEDMEDTTKQTEFEELKQWMINTDLDK